MGRSRYAGGQVIDDNHFPTWTDPVARNPMGPDILGGVEAIEHVLKAGERLDHLAHRYYGDSDYWWVIAVANRIQDPFALVPGTRLRVPSDVRSILDKVQR